LICNKKRFFVSELELQPANNREASRLPEIIIEIYFFIISASIIVWNCLGGIYQLDLKEYLISAESLPKDINYVNVI